jgi:hypothetical protein
MEQGGRGAGLGQLVDQVVLRVAFAWSRAAVEDRRLAARASEGEVAAQVRELSVAR